ncbi:hypothetical protein DL769_004128 [Monosporascus sp. CRB-8-3]|nr:hypothetical protein DL769_004128 [Monosporascus sp. CRB-8-3]
MASHDEDTMPEETQGYKLSAPKQSLAEYQKMGRFEKSHRSRTFFLKVQPRQIIIVLFRSCQSIAPFRIYLTIVPCWVCLSITPFRICNLLLKDLIVYEDLRQTKHDTTAAHPHADLMSPSPIISPRGSSQSNSSSLPTTMTGSLRFLQRLSSSGNAASQLDGRPSTQDTTTLVPSVQQSLFSFLTAHSQQETPQFGTTTTITGPSGRATPRENPLKRLMNWFQRDHGDDDDDSSSDSGLDPEMTCRGLPGIHYFEEVKVTSSPADPSSSNPQAQEDVISHFKTEKHILPNKKTLDENDESLQRYKQSLGLGGGKDLSDPNDPRVCIIQSLTMESPGRDPVTIDLSKPGSEQTLKDKPFKIKEGSKFTMVATFKVQHEILSGLQYVQVVKRKGLKVGKDSEMLGSYAPNTDKQPLYTKRFQEEDAPSGMLARGHYNAISSFVDDDKKTHLQFEWSFDISKDW